MKTTIMKHSIVISILILFTISIGSLHKMNTLTKGDDQVFAPTHYTNPSNQEEYALSFVALSDIHLKNYASIEEARFASALRFAYQSTNQKLDAIVLNGDYTDGGHDPQYQRLVNIRRDYSKPETPWIVNHGNHENGRNESDSHEFFRTMFGYSIDHVFEVNGYYFITLGVHSGDRYTVNQAKWLDQQIQHAIAIDPDRPVFVLIHYPATETVINSARGRNGRDTFKYVLEKYPQVIHISGHSHPALNDPRVIHQDTFTSFNNSSFYYLYLEHVDFRGNQDLASAGHFAMIHVTKDHVVHIKRYVLNDDQFGEARQIDEDFIIDVKQGVSGFRYTQQWYDDGSKPYFETDAFVSVERVGANVALRFDQAKDQRLVYYYTVNVIDQSSSRIVHVMKIRSEFYRFSVPTQIDYLWSNHTLQIGVAYRIQIYAHNPANRYSSPLEFDFVLG